MFYNQWFAGPGSHFTESLVFSNDPEIVENFVFIIIGLVAGAGIGATQSASRAVVGLLSPKKYSAQLFGFWGMFGRIAIVVGSLSFALVSDTLGRQQGLLVVLGFFVAGAIAILFVSLDQGIIDNE